jgi:predicted dinucleotide-utilizing enzyme
MGSPYREPRPKSPERISLRKIDFAGVVDGVPMVQATFAYDTWCCSDFHEVMDAVETLNLVVENASENAYQIRVKALKEEHDEILRELRESGQIQ